MKLHKFETGKYLYWQPGDEEGNEYIIIRHLKDRKLELQNTLTGLVVIEDANNLYRDFKHGKLRIYSGTDKFNVVASDEIHKGYNQYLVDLSSLPENEQEIMFRLRTCETV